MHMHMHYALFTMHYVLCIRIYTYHMYLLFYTYLYVFIRIHYLHGNPAKSSDFGTHVKLSSHRVTLPTGPKHADH